MKKIILILIVSTLQAQWSIEKQFNCVYSYVSLISEGNQKYILKQIKKTEQYEQIDLALDALGAVVAKSIELPANEITIISFSNNFHGLKKLPHAPATLHTFIQGGNPHRLSKFSDIDICQKVRRVTAEPNKGLTRKIIASMAQHKDLPAIVALDTFLCNIDRAPDNYLYNEESDTFYAIDFADSLRFPLAPYALKTLGDLKVEELTSAEKSARVSYTNTLQKLSDRWSADALCAQFDELIAQLQLGELEQETQQRIKMHKRVIKQNIANIALLLRYF